MKLKSQEYSVENCLNIKNLIGKIQDDLLLILHLFLG